MVIGSKLEMYKLYESGAFGNKFRSWRNVDDYLNSDSTGIVVLRYAGESGGRWCQYDLTRDMVPAVIDKWISQGAERSRITVGEADDVENIILQGEVQRGLRGFDLRYSLAKMPMRPALADHQLHASGLKAKMILEARLCPNSYADLMALMDVYPDAVVEFTTYRVDVGCIPNRNTVVWEVRNY